MSERKDGGPAFPLPAECGGYNPEIDGMSLRDWFAGQALAGMSPHHVVSPNEAKMMARSAYDISDAMLKARKEGGDA